MFCQNLIETLYVLVVYLIENLIQNAYSGTYSNVDNEFIVTNVRN